MPDSFKLNTLKYSFNFVYKLSTHENVNFENMLQITSIF